METAQRLMGCFVRRSSLKIFQEILKITGETGEDLVSPPVPSVVLAVEVEEIARKH
jgi:hypothetical protein